MIGCVPPDATAIGIFTIVRLRNFHDGVDGFNLRHQRQILIFLFVRGLDMVERDTLLMGEHLQNVARRHTAERVKTILRKMEFVFFGNHLPRAPVQRHGVGERAVAIENESLDMCW